MNTTKSIKETYLHPYWEAPILVSILKHNPTTTSPSLHHRNVTMQAFEALPVSHDPVDHPQRFYRVQHSDSHTHHCPTPRMSSLSQLPLPQPQRRPRKQGVVYVTPVLCPDRGTF
jgi:hypothetical protein